jgi:O-antigen/teichoic acid export membrane protein
MSDGREPPAAAAPEVESAAAPLAGGASVLLAGRLGARGLSFAVQLLLARLLGPAPFGLFAIGWTLFQVLGLVTTAGLEHGVTRYAAPLRREPNRLLGVARLAMGLAGAGGAAGAVLLFAAAPWLAERAFAAPAAAPVLRVFAAGLLFAPALKVAAAACRAALAMGRSVLAEDLAQPAVQLALVVAFHLLGWGVVGAATAAVVSCAAALVVAALALRSWAGTAAAPGPSAVGTRELVAFSLPVSLAGVLSPAGLWIDRLLVARYLPEAEVGIYQSATQVAFLFVLVLTAINHVVAPLVADGFRRGARATVEETYRVATKWGVYACLPAFLVLAWQPRLVLATLYDERYAAGAAPLVVLTLGQMFNLATGAVGLVLILSGRQRAWLALCALALAVQVVGGVTLIPRWGLVGAATATSVSLVVLFGSGLVLLLRREGLWPWDRRTLKGVAAALVAAAVLWAAARLPITAPWLRLAVAFVAAQGAFLVTLAALGFDAEDRELLAIVRQRARPSAQSG